MDKLSKYKELTLDSLATMGNEIAKALPSIIFAVVALLFGWLITKFILYITKKTLKLTKIEKLEEKINEIDFFGNKHIKVNITKVVLFLVKWTMIVIFLIIISDILNLKIISEQISNLLGNLPRLLSALVLFILGLLLANFIKNAIKSFFESLELSGAKIISQIVFTILLIFVSLTSLNQAGVNTEIITNNLTLILGAFLLSFTLALGFGAQPVVGDLFRTFYARKTYEVGQIIEYKGIVGEVEAIDNIALILKTADGKLVIPIKNIVESEIKIQN